MNFPKIGEDVRVVSFKHNGKLHRKWELATCVLNTNEMTVIVNNQTRVIEGNGTSWQTREPAVSFFFPNKWFNVIGMLRRDGVHFYCNLASPFIFEDKAIKYVDYDLDVKVFPSREYKIVDHLEYENHKITMHYPEMLDRVIKNQLDILIESILKKEYPFDAKFVLYCYDLFLRNTTSKEKNYKYRNYRKER